jgi:CheY-like chemotaxis protein
MANAPLRILLIEDDEVDSEYLQRCLRRHESTLAVSAVTTATAALDRLRSQGAGEALLPPWVLLLDLSLPGISGLEFLRLLRQDPNLRQHIVFVVGGSASDQEIAAAYDLQVAGYFLKGQLGEDCALLLSFLNAYQRLVTLPGYLPASRANVK